MPLQQIPESSAKSYRTQQNLTAVAVRAARRAWGQVDPAFISESWEEPSLALGAVLTRLQSEAALDGARSVPAALADQGFEVEPEYAVKPRAVAGFAGAGYEPVSVFESAPIVAKSRIAQGWPVAEAMAAGGAILSGITQTAMADAGRQGQMLAIHSRPKVGYVRMLNPPSCSRCAILAGRFYRWNAGFQRHPSCDCVHVASMAGSTQAARDEGLVDDPYAYFESLDEVEQDRVFTQAGAQAIRDGADISQVVNARRGMTANGNFTVEGTSRRGHAAQGLKRGQRRMTPESIYEDAARFGGRTEGERRQYALERLREHGYILPEGQVPGGSLRGQREGFGAMGRGGTRKAASQAVLDYRETGVRDPRSRYTMTDSERSLYDAQRRYERALTGVSPYTSPGFGQTPDPYGLGLNRVSAGSRPVTPVELATAERDYRWQLAAWGQRPIPWT